MSRLKKWLPKKKWKRVSLYVMSGLLTLTAADMMLTQYLRRIHVSRETTAITTPLTKRGTPDYLAALDALTRQGITPENNAAPLILEAMGSERMPQKWRSIALPLLGLADEGLPALSVSFVDWVYASRKDRR